MRLTWRKEPRKRGWPSLEPRGAILRVDGRDVGSVYAYCVGFQKWRGWCWVARHDDLGIQRRNTANGGRIFGTLDGAKDDCEAYVREQLGLAPKKKRGAK